MNRKKKQRSIAHNALIVTAIILTIFYVCRLWPLVLLTLICSIIALALLVTLSSPEQEKTETRPQIPQVVLPRSAVSRDRLAFSQLESEFTRVVHEYYPSARWVWETSDVRHAVRNQDPVYILLNRAGGFRRAKVVRENGRPAQLCYCTAKTPDLILDAEVETVPVPCRSPSLHFPPRMWIRAAT